MIALLLALSLSHVKDTLLACNPGQVAYVLPTPMGLVLTNYDPIQVPNPLSDHKVFLVTEDGALLREATFSSLGLETPGNPIWNGQSLLFVDFRKGIAVVLDRELSRLREFVIKGAHPYPYYPRFLAFSPLRQTVFITGCYPLRGYLELGCLQVHEFVGGTLTHHASSLESEPPESEWGYPPINWQWVIGVSPEGEPWVVEEAASRGFRRPVGRAGWEPLDFGAYTFRPPRYPKNPKDNIGKELAAAYLATGIHFLAGGDVVVPYASSAEGKTQLLVFSAQGTAIAKLTVPGRVVGLMDGLIVVAQQQRGWKLAHYRLQEKP